MLESAVGVRIVVTLQKGNGAETVIVGAPGALLLAVVVNGVVMSRADVTVPWSNDTPVRPVQAVAALERCAVSSTAVDSVEQKRSGMANTLNCFMISSTRRSFLPRSAVTEPPMIQSRAQEINSSNKAFELQCERRTLVEAV